MGSYYENEQDNKIYTTNIISSSSESKLMYIQWNTGKVKTVSLYRVISIDYNQPVFTINLKDK